jgi:hypothetical protein
MRVGAALVALLALCACRPPGPKPAVEVADARITVGVETAPGRVLPDYSTFAADTPFRLRLRATTELHLYPFRRTGAGYEVLAAPLLLAPYKDATLPAGEAWLRFGSGEGHEQFVLVAAPIALPSMAALRGALPAERLEKLWGEVERVYRPNGIRRYDEAGQVATLFFGPARQIALVLRLPLFRK